MYRSQFVYRFPAFSNLIFYRDHRCAMPIPMAWALYVRNPRHLARVIRAENHNSGNRMSAEDIGLGFNIGGVERHNAFRYRGKALEERQVRLVRNMRVKMRRR
jgi:hypothetical protein